MSALDDMRASMARANGVGPVMPVDYGTYDGDPLRGDPQRGGASGIPPRRPTIDDVGGGRFADDPVEPPDPITMATAAEFNQMGMLLVALGQVTAAAVLYVSNAGTPTIAALRAASSRLTAMPSATIGSVTTCGDFVLTRHAAGDIQIECPPRKLIQPLCPVVVTQAAGDYRASARVSDTFEGVRVETRDASGTLVDVDFFLMWM